MFDSPGSLIGTMEAMSLIHTGSVSFGRVGLEVSGDNIHMHHPTLQRTITCLNVRDEKWFALVRCAGNIDLVMLKNGGTMDSQTLVSTKIHSCRKLLGSIIMSIKLGSDFSGLECLSWATSNLGYHYVQLDKTICLA